MACRGTGQVISSLGGSPSSVECPWCGGSGQRQPGRDAQAKWQDQGSQAQAPVTAPPEPTDGAA